MKIQNWECVPGVMEDGQFHHTEKGTSQGGVISPLLANIYLHYMDTIWEKKCSHLGTLIRYADYFVIMCRTKKQAIESIQFNLQEEDAAMECE
jgi:RNA-directed DNA polymerase